MERIYKIYGMKDPLTLKVMYVGCTTASLSSRLSQHLYDAKNKKYKKNNWILSLLQNNLKPTIEELEITTGDLWKQRERYWINQFESPLNNSKGGDGIILDRTSESIFNSSKAKYVKIYQYHLDGSFIKEWGGAKVVEQELNIIRTSIGNNLNGRTNSAGGFRWSYDYVEKLPEPEYKYKYYLKQVKNEN